MADKLADLATTSPQSAIARFSFGCCVLEGLDDLDTMLVGCCLRLDDLDAMVALVNRRKKSTQLAALQKLRNWRRAA